MRRAVRAIIIEDGKILVIARNKQGDQYFTLPGGKVGDNETNEQALKREIYEETSLKISSQRLVFVEEHPEPYNEQYIYLCEAEPHGDVGLHAASEELMMNRLGTNIHTPVWVYSSSFGNLPFRTPQLSEAIVAGIKKGFPDHPIKL